MVRFWRLLGAWVNRSAFFSWKQIGRMDGVQVTLPAELLEAASLDTPGFTTTFPYLAALDRVVARAVASPPRNAI